MDFKQVKFVIKIKITYIELYECRVRHVKINIVAGQMLFTYAKIVHVYDLESYKFSFLVKERVLSRLYEDSSIDVIGHNITLSAATSPPGVSDIFQELMPPLYGAGVPIVTHTDSLQK